MKGVLSLLVVVCGVVVALAGCAPKAYVRKGMLDNPPKRVAVLPFVIRYSYDTEGGIPPEAHRIGRDTFRKTFYYAFTPYGYEDVKLAQLDEKLTQAYGSLEQGSWRQESPQRLGELLGADALIYGDIDRLMHMATPLYTQTSIDAQLRMVEAATGDVLWQRRVKAAERGGALLKKGQVVDFLKDLARTRHPQIKFLRVADVAVRHALRKLPNPPMSIGPTDQASRKPGTARLAILPFAAKRKGWGKAAESLRRNLAANLQESPFEIVELQRVDGAIKTLGWSEAGSWPEAMSLPELGRMLGADAFLRATLTKWGRTYLAVQSWVKAELGLELIDASSGELILSKKRANTRQAGILKGPTGYTSIATSPIMGLLPSHLERVANHLARDMAEDLSTSPAVLTYVAETK